MKTLTYEENIVLADHIKAVDMVAKELGLNADQVDNIVSCYTHKIGEIVLLRTRDQL